MITYLPKMVSSDAGVSNLTGWTIVVVISIGLLLWPAFYNGQPIFYDDTSSYIRAFDAGLVWLTGYTGAWTTWASFGPNHSLQWSVLPTIESLQSPSFIIAGRSVLYGAFLYLGDLLGGLWATTLLQSGIAAAALFLTLRHLRILSKLTFFSTVALLSVLTPVAFVNAVLLPDIFTGLCIIGAANLLVLDHPLKRWEYLFWLTMLIVAVISHPTNLALSILLLAAGLLIQVCRASFSKAGLAALGFACFIGFAGEASFALIVKKALGAQMVRPPVVLARIIADGPGATYLRKYCPQAHFTACEFADQLFFNSDAFLWDKSEHATSYINATEQKRFELGEEQLRFALAVFASDPIGQSEAWLIDFLRQMRMFGLSDYLTKAEGIKAKLPKAYAEQLANSGIWTGAFNQMAIEAVFNATLIMSLAIICMILGLRWQAIPPKHRRFYFVILSGVLLNALICGVLSGPHERYQARVIWLLPLAAAMMCFSLFLLAENKRETQKERDR